MVRGGGGQEGGEKKVEGIKPPEQLMRPKNVWKIFFII